MLGVLGRFVDFLEFWWHRLRPKPLTDYGGDQFSAPDLTESRPSL